MRTLKLNGLTVGQLIDQLQKYDRNLLVVGPAGEATVYPVFTATEGYIYQTSIKEPVYGMSNYSFNTEEYIEDIRKFPKQKAVYIGESL